MPKSFSSWEVVLGGQWTTLIRGVEDGTRGYCRDFCKKVTEWCPGSSSGELARFWPHFLTLRLGWGRVDSCPEEGMTRKVMTQGRCKTHAPKILGPGSLTSGCTWRLEASLTHSPGTVAPSMASAQKQRTAVAFDSLDNSFRSSEPQFYQF